MVNFNGFKSNLTHSCTSAPNDNKFHSNAHPRGLVIIGFSWMSFTRAHTFARLINAVPSHPSSGRMVGLVGHGWLLGFAMCRGSSNWKTKTRPAVFVVAAKLINSFSVVTVNRIKLTGAVAPNVNVSWKISSRLVAVAYLEDERT